jgi:EAL domain-containing protein (putative c-di-GMP-specific phosphodiesterase class I)
LIQQLNHNELAKAMTRCVVDMGKALGIDVVADGVETDVQLSVLVSQGCHLVQGFLTGRPMSPQVLSGCLTGSAAGFDAFSAMGAV